MTAKLTLLLLLLCGLAPHTKVWARTTGTPESIAIQNVKSGIRVFQEANGGRAPTNWTQFDQELLEILNRGLVGTSAHPLQAHYVFIQGTIPMLGFEEGDVLLIRTEPVKNSAGERGRYIISHTNGGLHFSFYKEDRVQRLLTQPGVRELPEVRTLLLSSLQSSSSAWPVVAALAVIAGAVVYVLVRKVRKRE